jgi:hypothetical protein
MVQQLTKPNTAPTDDDRGSGRAWYRVQVGGYEPITLEDGSTSQQFVLDGFNIEVDAGGWFGWGVKDAIEQAAVTRCPGRQLIDFWPLSSPPAER